MSDYDGYVKIGTKLDTKGVDSKLMQLSARLSKCADSAEMAQKKLDAFANTQINTKEYQEVIDQIEKWEKEITKLEEKQAKFINDGKGTEYSKKYQGMTTEINRLKASIVEAKDDMVAMEQAGKAFVPPESLDKYAQLEASLRNALAQLDIAKQKIDEYEGKSRKAGKATDYIKNSLKGVVNVAKTVGSTLANMSKNFTKHFGKSSNMVTKLGKRITGLAKRVFIFSMITKALRAMREAITKGVQAIAKMDGDFNSVMSNFKTSFATLQASIGGLVQPIISAVVPALTTLCDWLTEAVNKANQLVSALTGASTWKKAVKVQQDYASALEESAKASKSLQGFNELNNISSGSSSGSSSSAQYTTEEISGDIKSFANNLKATLASEDWSAIGAIIADKINGALKAIDWNAIQQDARTFATQLGTLLNGFFAETDWMLIGSTIGNGINSALAFSMTFVNTFDFKQAGKSIGDGISSAVRTIKWSDIGKTFSDGVAGALEFMIQLLHNTDWYAVGESIGDIFKSIDWIKLIADLGQLLWELVCGAFEVLFGFGYSLGEDLSDWFDEIGENGWAGFLEGLWDGIVGFVTWIADKIDEYIIQPWKDVLGIHSPSTVFAEIGSYCIDGLKEGIGDIWEKIKEPFINVKEKIEKVFDDIRDKISDTFYKIKDIIRTPINAILNFIETMVNGIINGFNSAIKALNNLQIKVPDWVPEIGGKTMGFNIGTLGRVYLPRLANGGITTGSTLAQIGEAGREAVLPLENNTGWMDDLAEKLAGKMGSSVTFKVEGDPSGLFKVTQQQARDYTRRTGKEAFA